MPVVEEMQPAHPPVVPPVVETLHLEDRQLEADQYDAAAERAFNDLEPESALEAISSFLLGEFSEAEQLRQDTEQRWLKDLRQFRGQYEPDTLKELKGRSQAFVRRTRVKVVTTDARMMDYLFPAGQEKNWTCDNTPNPSVSDDVRAGVHQQLAQRMGGQQPSKKQVDDAIVALCREAAKGMTKVIEDQLVEVRYKQITRRAVHSGNLYGTGIIKGPLVERKVRQRFSQVAANKWEPRSEEYIVPFVDFVPLWRFYPDMAATELDQCRFVYELHLMTRHEVSALISRKSFDGQKIKEYLEANPRGSSSSRTYENELKALGEREGTSVRTSGMYEVLERWGWLTGEQLQQAGVKVEPDRLLESFFCNVWLLPNGTIIKAKLQPINGVTWPYHLYYFDKDETSIFGEGLASIMRDDQEMLNAAIRMMLDNGALTSGPMLEIALDQLATTERADEVFPWKIWYRKQAGDLSRPAVRQVQLDNNLEWLTKLAAIFENNTDEVTAIPRYMTGENATTGAAGTASGMSMLMGAANIVIKELLNSWDEGVTRTFIQALYRWNMQFSRDNSIKGDFDVKARGTASLIAKELRAVQLSEFAQGPAQQPRFAPFIKDHKLLQQIAEAAEMSDVIKSEDEVKEEQDSENAKKTAELQQRLAEAQVREQEAKAAKLLAEAQVAKTKVDEMLANIEKILDDRVGKRVETIFAALQAGGVATRDPVTAPAGDEILRSAGYKDLTPEPTIAQLAGPPVQGAQQTVRVASKGESFAPDPRVAGTVDPQSAAEATPQDAVPPEAAPRMPDANDGQRAGIETARIDS